MSIELQEAVNGSASINPGHYRLTIACSDNDEFPIRSRTNFTVTILPVNSPPGPAFLAPLTRMANKILYSHDENAFAAIDGSDPDGRQDILRFDLVDSSGGAFVLEQGMLRLGQYGDPVAFDNTTVYSFVIRTTDRSGLYSDTRFQIHFSANEKATVTTTPITVARRNVADDNDNGEQEALYVLAVPYRLLDDSLARNRPKSQLVRVRDCLPHYIGRVQSLYLPI